MDDFVPSEMLKRAMRYWWLIALLMVAGGALGYLAAKLQKPVYESQASITTSIDFAYAGRLNEDEEDYLILTVGDVIDSSKVLEAVVQKASAQGINITMEDVKTYFSKARQGYRWELTVRDFDPQVAQTLTQLWVDESGAALADFRQKSLDMLEYQSAQIALQNCFSQTVVLDPVSASCSLENVAALRSTLSETSTQEKSNTMPNAMLLSKISTEITDNAYLPGSPITLKMNYSAVAGCFCGLLVGLGILFFGKTKA